MGVISVKREVLGRSMFEGNEDSVLDLFPLRCSLSIQVDVPGWQLDK